MESLIKNIGIYKNGLLTPLLNSDDIKDILIVGEEYSDELWYGKDGDDNDYGIVYDQIFPYLYIDDTQTKVKAYICFEVNITKIPTASIKDITVIVWCFCHKSCMQYSKKGYYGNRADILSDAIERALRQAETNSKNKGNAKFGIGKLQLQSVTQLTSTSNNYYGRQLIFTTSDFKFKN